MLLPDISMASKIQSGATQRWITPVRFSSKKGLPTETLSLHFIEASPSCAMSVIDKAAMSARLRFGAVGVPVTVILIIELLLAYAQRIGAADADFVLPASLI
jgi:hypothetical protein